MKSRLAVAVGSFAVMVGACSADNIASFDGGFDGGTDAMTVDATTDATETGTVDAPVDVAVDAPPDVVVIDAPSDAPPDAPPDVVAIDAPSDAPPAATFTQIYNSIIAVRCNGCHSSSGHSSALDLSTKVNAYAALVGVDAAGVSCGSSGLKRIVAGNVAASLLHQKVSGTQTCGASMPFGSTLSLSDRDLVASWIAAGAKND